MNGPPDQAPPPAIPADLRALLEALLKAHDARDAADTPGGDGVAWGRCDAEHEDAVADVINWTRAHAGATPAPLTDDELAAMWRLRIGTSPSPNGMTLMRAIRDHAGGGR